uniref:Uncharacterized protein n=1 Tax=Arundo donax TaxID=35708 RepID=A0A0A8YD56_ARUDO
MADAALLKKRCLDNKKSATSSRWGDNSALREGIADSHNH